MSELERRHIEEQLGGVMETLAELRAELELVKEALSRAQREAGDSNGTAEKAADASEQ